MTVQWWIQGRGPGGLCPPPPNPAHALLYIPNWVPKGWKFFLENRAQPLTSGSGWPGPPLSQGLDLALLLLTVTDILTTCAGVIFTVKVSCIMSVDDVKLWLLTWLVNWSISLLKWPVCLLVLSFGKCFKSASQGKHSSLKMLYDYSLWLCAFINRDILNINVKYSLICSLCRSSP